MDQPPTADVRRRSKSLPPSWTFSAPRGTRRTLESWESGNGVRGGRGRRGSFPTSNGDSRVVRDEEEKEEEEGRDELDSTALWPRILGDTFEEQAGSFNRATSTHLSTVSPPRSLCFLPEELLLEIVGHLVEALEAAYAAETSDKEGERSDEPEGAYYLLFRTWNTLKVVNQQFWQITELYSRSRLWRIDRKPLRLRSEEACRNWLHSKYKLPRKNRVEICIGEEAIRIINRYRIQHLTLKELIDENGEKFDGWAVLANWRRYGYVGGLSHLSIPTSHFVKAMPPFSFSYHPDTLIINFDEMSSSPINSFYHWGSLLHNIQNLVLIHTGNQVLYHFPVLDPPLPLSSRLRRLELRNMARLLIRQPLNLFANLRELLSFTFSEDVGPLSPTSACWRREILPFVWAEILDHLPNKLDTLDINDTTSVTLIWLPFLVGALDNMASLATLGHLTLHHAHAELLWEDTLGADLRDLYKRRRSLSIQEKWNRWQRYGEEEEYL